MPWFSITHSPSPKKSIQSPKKVNSINVVNQIEDFYAEPALDSDSISIARPAEEPGDHALGRCRHGGDHRQVLTVERAMDGEHLRARRRHRQGADAGRA